MTISVIFARNHANIIGVDKKLPWDIKEDMTWFKKHTLNQTVIMGRKTYESMGSKPLPDRSNVVVSSMGMNKTLITRGPCFVATDLAFALQLAKQTLNKDILIIGGASLIKEAIPFADRIIMTTVGKSIDVSKHHEVTRLDVRGLEGYYNEYMYVDDLAFKMVEANIRSLPDRQTGYTEFVHFTVHNRVRY